MKKFSIKLDSFVASDVAATGDLASYERRAHDGPVDYVVKRDGKEVLRVTASHILYVEIAEVSTI